MVCIARAPGPDRDRAAVVMDYYAIHCAIHGLNSPGLMAYSAEYMYGATVILRCDGALLWIIKFTLLLYPRNALFLIGN
ncbi:hypothetical protein CRX51_14795 [Pluralibacter gergoviae]|nr:hypothetical protein CRX51_14795 [Pluralibacter gergoviae]